MPEIRKYAESVLGAAVEMARKYRVWISVPRLFREDAGGGAPGCKRVPGNVEVAQDVFAYTQEEALEQIKLLIRTDGQYFEGKIFKIEPHPDAIPKPGATSSLRKYEVELVYCPPCEPKGPIWISTEAYSAADAITQVGQERYLYRSGNLGLPAIGRICPVESA